MKKNLIIIITCVLSVFSQNCFGTSTANNNTHADSLNMEKKEMVSINEKKTKVLQTTKISAVDSLDNIKKDSENANTSKIDTPLTSDVYIKGLNILVTITIFVFGFFIATNIITDKRNITKTTNLLEESNKELKKIRSHKDALVKSLESANQTLLEDIKTSKEELIEDIITRIINRNISNEANIVHIKTVKEKLSQIINSENPKAEEVYFRLTDIIEYADFDSLDTISKCMKIFSSDPDIMDKCQLIIENISKKNSQI